MSFTAKIKEELAGVSGDCTNCNRAELAAIVRIEGTLTISARQPRLEISTENLSLARTASMLLHKLYSLNTEMTVRRSVLHKTQNYLVTIPAQKALSKALEELGVIGANGLEMGIADYLVKQDCCAAAYLRGAFIASGYLSNPKKRFHLEIATSSQDLADDMCKLISRYNIVARTKKRNNVYSAYIKNANAISSFLALVKAHKSVLEFENIRVVKSIKNDTNRRVNAEIANAHKASAAAAQQINNIRFLLKYGDHTVLPDTLVEIARLRLEHPYASIKELGTYAQPPLSKNAVYHRMCRLDALINEQRKRIDYGKQGA